MRLKILDARALPGAGRDPSPAVQEAFEALGEEGVLEVHGLAEAEPVAASLRARGASVESAKQEDGTWMLRASRGPLPRLDDLTALEPCGPMERVLAAAAALDRGAVYLARLPRFPRLLIPHLENRGLTWQIELRPDRTAVLWLRARA